MSLDAFVRCNCFEEGKCKPAPVPFEDLYVDETSGYIELKKNMKACEEQGGKEADNQYMDLHVILAEWQEHCCEHEDGQYCSEWVGNIAGMSSYKSLISAVGEEKLPILSEMFPEGNDGTFPVELAEAALKELDILDEESTVVYSKM